MYMNIQFWNEWWCCRNKSPAGAGAREYRLLSLGVTEDVSGELTEADVASAGLLAVVEDLGHEEVGVEGDRPHRREAEEP